jgi:hypothetical protein
MLIKVDANGNIQTVLRQTGPLEGFIEIIDNEELISYPDRFKYVNNTLTKKYRIDFSTDMNFNMGGYYELPINTTKNLIFTIVDENLNTIPLNKTITSFLYTILGLYKQQDIVFTNGTGNLTLNESSYGDFIFGFNNDFDAYFESIRIKVI